MTTIATAGSTALDIPDLPDIGAHVPRMRCPAARLHEGEGRRRARPARQRQRRRTPPAPAGRCSMPACSHVERPVAVVLADDEHPHLFMPFREGSASETEVPADHVHGPLYLEFDEGVEHFAAVLADLVPAGATVAVDELTGAMRRAQARLFSVGCRRRTPHRWSAPPSWSRRPTRSSCIRKACRITEEGHGRRAEGARCRAFGRSTCPRRSSGARSNSARPPTCSRPIWQVMPTTKASGAVWTTTGDLALPLLTTERELAAGDVLWTDVSITYDGYCSDFGRTWVVGDEPSARQQAQFEKWREILDAVLAVTKAGATAGDLARAAIAANGGEQAVAAALLPRPRHRHQRRRNADDRNRSRSGVRRQLRVPRRHGAGAGTGGLGGRHRRLSKRGDRGHHRGRLQSITDYPYAPYGRT